MNENDIKENWSKLNLLLDRNPCLTQKNIKDIIYMKTNSTVTQLTKCEKHNLYITAASIMLFIALYLTGYILHWYSFALIEVLLTIGLIFNVYALNGLANISLSGSILVFQKSFIKYKRLHSIYEGLFPAIITLLCVTVFFIFEGINPFDCGPYSFLFVAAFIIALIISIRQFKYFKSKQKQIDKLINELNL